MSMNVDEGRNLSGEGDELRHMRKVKDQTFMLPPEVVAALMTQRPEIWDMAIKSYEQRNTPMDGIQVAELLGFMKQMSAEIREHREYREALIREFKPAVKNVMGTLARVGMFIGGDAANVFPDEDEL